MKIEKLNKLLTFVVGLTIVVNIINIINVLFFSTDFLHLTSQIQLVANFVASQDIQSINTLLDIVKNTIEVLHSLRIVFSVGTALISIGVLFIFKLLTKRTCKYPSIFNYASLLIVSLLTIFVQIKIMPSFSSFTNILLIVTAILGIAIAIGCIVASLFSLQKIFMSDQFKAKDLSFDLIKILSLVAGLYMAAIIITRVGIYIIASVAVKEIDLAAIIDVMNYIDIDWNAIIPQEIMGTGVISANSIDMFINRLADQYILSFVTIFVQNQILNFVRFLIFKNILVYIIGLFTASGLLFSVKAKFAYKSYVLLSLLVIALLVFLVYIAGLLGIIIGIGYLICIGLICLDLYKESDSTFVIGKNK